MLINKVLEQKSCEELSKINDTYGNTLYYRLNLQKIPNGLPLLVVLHGNGSSPTNFKQEGWNVLAPFDNYGYDSRGCWWLGESGDFFLKDLLQRLIKEISIKYKCEDNIYFYGSSMGGYGAILHGILSNARGVYANVPQIQFYNSTYFKNNFAKNANAIFNLDKPLPIENNLLEVLEKYKNKKLPTFFLCENMIEKKKHLINYLEEHSLLFARKCYEYQIKLHLELLPYEGHMKNYGLKEVLNKFERFIPIDNNEPLNIEEYFYFISDLWFLNKIDLIDNIIFKKSKFSLITKNNKKGDIFYIISGNANLGRMGENEENYIISNYSLIDFKIDIIETKNCKLSCFIIEFDNKEKNASIQYNLTNGLNTIHHILHTDSKYVKIAFRIVSLLDGVASFEVNTLNIKFS